MNFQHDSTEAFEGVLYQYRGGWLTLKDAAALKANLPPVKIPGDVIVHRSTIAYLQVVA